MSENPNNVNSTYKDFIKYLFADHPHSEAIISSKVNKNLPLYLDRFIETLNSYPLSIDKFIDIVTQNGLPYGDYFKEKFIKEFGKSDSTHLFDSYSEKDDLYTLRLMLTYTRVDFIEPYYDTINSLITKKVKKVLDYGCGVSDIGIFLAQHGWDVTIVDLDTPKLKFAEKRYANRGLNVNVVKIRDTEYLPNIDNTFDLIIATEIIEHYRYPIKMINYFYDHINLNGLLLNSLGDGFERERGADHLDESLEEGASQEYQTNYNSKFKLIKVPHQRNWLFQKI